MKGRNRAVPVIAALLLAASPLLPGLCASGTAAGQVRHNCSFCHNLHGGSYTQLRDYAVTEDLCLSCHSEAGPAQVDRDGTLVAVPRGPYAVHNGARHAAPTGCWDCHNHEGEAGGNLSMIQANLPTPNSGTLPVVFTARTGLHSFADSVAPFDGVCEVCHTATTHHRNTAGWEAYHNAQTNCTTCHRHSGGFAARGGCAGCHNAPQAGRRTIIAEFERTSHHVNWSSYPNGLAADSIPDATCQVCHDQSAHQQGNVRLWNVDQPQNTAAAIVLTGNPLAVQAEADKLAPFCLACHDANGANGNLTPFGDGGSAPVVVSVTAWASASHNAPGKASCFGCHGSGHGSEKTRLLMPDVGAISTPDSANVQEGFCLRCHDADGPSTKNLKTYFDRAINWVQQATGLGANPNLNDRHDIQYAAQLRSGAKIECRNCHQVHTLTSGRKYLLDPDASDGHVPGTNWYFAAYQTANDTLSEFCLDCHDGSLPTGVSAYSGYTLTNIRTTWANDGMGQRTSGNVNLKAGFGWAIGDVLACRVCHTSHGRIDADANATTLFGAVDTVRAKGSSTPIPFWLVSGRTTTNIFNYALTNNLDTNDLTSGGYWCNSCHDRTAMTGKSNCYSCHRHGDGGRF